MPPAWNATTLSREKRSSLTVAAGYRRPTPSPPMQANIRSLTK